MKIDSITGKITFEKDDVNVRRELLNRAFRYKEYLFGMSVFTEFFDKQLNSIGICKSPNSGPIVAVNKIPSAAKFYAEYTKDDPYARNDMMSWRKSK